MQRANSIHVFQPPPPEEKEETKLIGSAKVVDILAKSEQRKKGKASIDMENDAADDQIQPKTEVPDESELRVFDLDFAMENAWQRSFKRMKRAVAASDDNVAELELNPDKEDAEERGREWEIAKLQREIKQTTQDFADGTLKKKKAEQ